MRHERRVHTAPERFLSVEEPRKEVSCATACRSPTILALSTESTSDSAVPRRYGSGDEPARD
jgi:hypothetical protein